MLKLDTIQKKKKRMLLDIPLSLSWQHVNSSLWLQTLQRATLTVFPGLASGPCPILRSSTPMPPATVRFLPGAGVDLGEAASSDASAFVCDTMRLRSCTNWVKERTAQSHQYGTVVHLHKCFSLPTPPPKKNSYTYICSITFVQLESNSAQHSLTKIVL